MITDTVWDDPLESVIKAFRNPYDVVLEREDEPQEEPTLDFWNDDTWNDDEPFKVDFSARTDSSPPLTVEQAQVNRAQIRTGESSSIDWRTRFENGRIPAEALTNVNGFGLLKSDAAAGLKALKRAAKRAGHDLSGGGYRDYDTQVQVYNDPAKIINGEHLGAVPGTSEHGWGEAIDISGLDYGSPAYQWLMKNGKKYGWVNPEWAQAGGSKPEPWHFEYQGGYSPRSTRPKNQPQPKGRPRSRGRSFEAIDLVSSRSALTSSKNLSFGLMGIGEDLEMARRGVTEPEIRGAGSDKGLSEVEVQIRRGFLKAGRPDLARMVGTKSFNTWLGAESGMNPMAVSPANNQGLANDGLFQVWRGHAFNSEGQFSRYSAQKQARLVAKFFPDLSPNSIRSYAQAIAKGTYRGWP